MPSIPGRAAAVTANARGHGADARGTRRVRICAVASHLRDRYGSTLGRTCARRIRSPAPGGGRDRLEVEA